MANALTIQSYEHDLIELRPTIQDVIPANVPPERLMRTVLISLERTPTLLECTKSSVLQAAVTLAVLGLEADGATGQGFLIPFNNRHAGTKVAQTVIGYKGYNTLAARNGFMIRGARVYEGDIFDIDLGRPAPIIHKPDLVTPLAQRKLIGCWALATSNIAPSVPVWMNIDELEAVRAKSPGAKKSDSPWNDVTVGRPAMYEKTVKRRLQRAMPLSAQGYMMGAVMDEAHEERGLHSWITPEKIVETSASHVLTSTQPPAGAELDHVADQPPSPFIINKGSAQVTCPNEDEWQAKMLVAIQSIAQHKDEKARENLQRFRELNGPVMAQLYEAGFQKNVRAVDEAFNHAFR